MTGEPEPIADSARPSSGLPAVQAAIEETGAAGFVHVGGRADADLRYLTRVDGPDREMAVVFLPGDADHEPEAVYCVPRDVVGAVSVFEERADPPDIAHRVVSRNPTTATGQQVRAILAERHQATGDDRTLLVPRQLPHDTAVFLQQAGYELQSTAAITTARATKTPVERDCLRTVQAAATAGMARAEAVLATSEPADEGLTLDGRPLTAERLRRRIDAELVSVGVSPAANTRITASTAASAPLPAGEPIRLQVAPRGPHGYHGSLTRTLAVDSEGGWERRGFIAAEAGLQAAVRQLEPGVDVSTVEGEAVAEVGAYGFAVASDDPSTRARATAVVHGVGLSAYEPPASGTESELHSGSVVAVETGVDDPTRGAIRLGTLFELSEEGVETLVEYPYSLSPVDRLDTD
ncbi:M24 family metallopeptidase [Halohasta litorea]|uniref:M24 family metallopeptidase n=1 Tax=Halohasta litorea TaxID=869891 RepID=A0ABD6D9T4_9EURY|nr:M24 family metallopeptidase [Halohasta litorea]